jgi:hypothetical protein
MMGFALNQDLPGEDFVRGKLDRITLHSGGRIKAVKHVLLPSANL